MLNYLKLFGLTEGLLLVKPVDGLGLKAEEIENVAFRAGNVLNG
jgi:hypothetical protein